MRDAEAIVGIVGAKFGLDNVAILTAPSLDPECVPGKRRWIQTHFSYFADRMIYTAAKRFLGGPGRVLIDDKNANCDEFAAAGGIAILVPRPWNSLHRIADRAAEHVRESLDYL
jgi:5'(3')-deoxyribonucleotidase